jgi:SAM-dependent methyltransferase
MRESRRRQFTGSVLQLGKQEVWTTDDAMLRMAKKEACPLLTVKGDFKTQKSKFVDSDCMSDVKFFKTLGFSTVHSVDVNSWEGADIIHDLNLPFPPDSPHREKYDVIFDGGTLEHIFHVPNVLKNIYDLLAVGGRIIHQSPVDMFGHGFYNFSTCFFEDFYRANEFEINTCGVVSKPYGRDFNDESRYSAANFDSQFVRSLCEESFDKATHLIVFVATKRACSTGDRIPTQGYFQDAFDEKKNFGNSGLVEGDSLLKSIYGQLRSVPVVSSLARHLRNAYARSLVKWDKL